ncbi:MAG TPA: triose-phosphate isomerase [Candidatus Paceibacterota bacterium]|nr:triose-phosphate isomerase [Candidatus Paceibacterota bacterium]
MKKYVIANWKMNPQTWAEAEGILDYVNSHFENESAAGETSLVICPPFVFLEEAAKVMTTSFLARNAELGAQDIALAESGAWTGEISGPMLSKLGVKYVIVGHSERRWKMGESNETVNEKLKAALKDELTPIVCVGERERDADYKDFLRKQMEATFAGLSADEIGKCLLAYEPVWAISTNPNAKPDTPEQTLESVAVIKEFLGNEIKVLYGGSINKNNAKDFLSVDELAGVLVGGASVRKEEFVEILNAV